MASNIGLDTLSTKLECYPPKAVTISCPQPAIVPATDYGLQPPSTKYSDGVDTMFEFSESTRGIDAPRTVRIIRTPASGFLNACIINSAPVCHAVHWCGERTLPHTSTQPCLWCEREHVLKIEVYIGIWIPADDHVRILTLTDYAAQPALMFRERYGDLRGCQLNVHRPSGKKKRQDTLCGDHRSRACRGHAPTDRPRKTSR